MAATDTPQGRERPRPQTSNIRLVDAAGREEPTTRREIASHLHAGGFFWIDVEHPGDDELAELCKRLRLPAKTTESIVHPTARSSFAVVADAVRAVLPAAVDTRPSEAWLEANYVTLVLTEQFLLSVHLAPCAPLDNARHQYHALDERARTDPAQILFLIVNNLVDSFGSQLVALDDRLGEIQLGMLHGASPHVHHELVQILGILTQGIQELGWYSYDLDEVAETVDKASGMGPGTQKLLDRHRQRVTRMGANLRDIREEAREALSRYSESVAGRQAQVINALTIVATVFLPLSFLTGYFGMNFATLTNHVQNKTWQFILLGLVLPLASAALSLVLIWRLERRLGLGIRQFIGR